MGVGSSKEASFPTPKISSDGAPIAPDRSQRSHCWDARDNYYSCLDKNGIVDSIKEKEKAEKACAVEGKRFEANCAESWVRSSQVSSEEAIDISCGGENGADHIFLQVTYFKKRRVMEYQRNQALEKLKKENAQEIK
jgi:cytochrome c oxidase assembly factor 6